MNPIVLEEANFVDAGKYNFKTMKQHLHLILLNLMICRIDRLIKILLIKISGVRKK